jgi:glutathione reductase (NADPH)
MSTYDYDLLVLGAGSGGLATSKRAASYGARAAIIESDRVGGTCVIRGCIPKKLMVYAAESAHAAVDARDYGWDVTVGGHDWSTLVTARDAAVTRLERRHEELLGNAGVELLRGHARVTGPQEVEVAGRRLRARYLLVATGSRPEMPTVEGIEHAITSDGFFELTGRPGHIGIVGSGYIGCEFACFLAGLGCRVTMFVRRDLPLSGFDDDLRREVLDGLRRLGVEVWLNSTVEGITRDGDGSLLDVRCEGSIERVRVDQALVYAIGRTPNTADLGLAEVGVALGDRGEVVCDELGRTAVESILAVGDVTGRAMLTPVAIQAGRAIADRIFGGKSTKFSYDNIPSAVFTDPPIGTVGLTETQAAELYGADEIKVYKARFTPLSHTLTERKVPTLVKLVVTGAQEKVVGCHIVGHDGPEIIQGFAVAVKMGATKADLDATVGIHPSTAEEFVTMT